MPSNALKTSGARVVCGQYDPKVPHFERLSDCDHIRMQRWLTANQQDVFDLLPHSKGDGTVNVVLGDKLGIAPILVDAERTPFVALVGEDDAHIVVGGRSYSRRWSD